MAEVVKYLNKGYVEFDPGEVSLKDCLLSKSNLEEYVSSLAAISRGKEKSNNPEKRFEGLLKECSPSGSIDFLQGIKHVDNIKDYREQENVKNAKSRPSRPLEFVPVTIHAYEQANGEISESGKIITTYGIFAKDDKTEIGLINDYEFNNLLKFSFIEKIEIDNVETGYDFNNLITYSKVRKYLIHTNLRALINTGLDYNKVIMDRPIQDYKEAKFMVFRIKAPMFVWAQIMTHTLLSKESKSDRVTTESPMDKDYYFPEDLFFKYVNSLQGEDKKSIEDKNLTKEEQYEFMKNKLVNELSATEVYNLFKDLGYGKEVYNRATYYLQYKTFVLAGYVDRKTGLDGFSNLLKERTNIERLDGSGLIHKHWTQSETRELCNIIKEFYFKYY